MKKIALSQGKFAKVDDSDYDFLNKHKWTLAKGRLYHSIYAKRNIYIGYKKHKTVYMHSVLLNTPHGMDTDHIDGDGLNNQRHNLRICSRADNLKNRKSQSNNISGFKGVCWDNDKKKWRAYISCNKKWHHLGFFIDKLEAYKTYCSASLKYHKSFSRIK